MSCRLRVLRPQASRQVRKKTMPLKNTVGCRVRSWVTPFSCHGDSGAVGSFKKVFHTPVRQTAWLAVVAQGTGQDSTTFLCGTRRFACIPERRSDRVLDLCQTLPSGDRAHRPSHPTLMSGRGLSTWRQRSIISRCWPSRVGHSLPALLGASSTWYRPKRCNPYNSASSVASGLISAMCRRSTSPYLTSSSTCPIRPEPRPRIRSDRGSPPLSKKRRSRRPPSNNCERREFERQSLYQGVPPTCGSDTASAFFGLSTRWSTPYALGATCVEAVLDMVLGTDFLIRPGPVAEE
jgi:hypothetical protein